MLVRLTGILESISGNEAVLAVDEARAFEVLLPTYLADRLGGRHATPSALGTRLTLHVMEYLEALNQGSAFLPRIIGFATPAEREFFELFTSVKGLGNKRALRALALEPGTIARSIAERDARALQRLPEIGPKLADLIVHELKGKVDAMARSSAITPPVLVPQVEVKSKRARAGNASASTGAANPPPPPIAHPPIRQTVDALVALGEDPSTAERMVAAAVERARAAGTAPPVLTTDLLAAAYATR